MRTLTMSFKEADKIQIMRMVLEKKLKQGVAARLLNLCVRQIRRIKDKLLKEGAEGIIHRLRGRPSNNKTSEGILEKAKKLIKKKYADFGPLLAQEHLKDDDKIKLSKETVRKLMITTELWKPRKRKEKHRAWRERKECLGMMLQLDGSTHAWFENRSPKCVLIAFIDDATSNVLFAMFADSETTINLFRALKAYILKNGIPRSLYVDRDGIYKVNLSKSEKKYIEEDVTQFSRAAAELGIEMIFAYSPQAKGRIERLFGTFQDRLIKEMRLAGINGIEQGNKFLVEQFLPFYNNRYSVPAKSPVDLHTKQFKKRDLDGILCPKSVRLINRDFTVQLDNRFYQIEEEQLVKVYSKKQVTIEERLDGSMRMLYKGKYLNFHKIIKQPYRPRFAFYPRDQKTFWQDNLLARHSNAVKA